MLHVRDSFSQLAMRPLEIINVSINFSTTTKKMAAAQCRHARAIAHLLLAECEGNEFEENFEYQEREGTVWIRP